ncbi:MAG: tetratricopeptide [Verrucomicrobiaceae bacterium]|nr:tetratricopeptide [Verrucomicrobiaceae bacterium]
MTTIQSGVAINNQKDRDAIVVFEKVVSVFEEKAAADVKAIAQFSREWFDALASLDNPVARCERFLDAVAKGEPDALAYHLAGIISARIGKHDDAIGWYQKTLQLDADDALVWRNLGSSQSALLDFTSAIASYRKVLELDAINSDAWSDLGISQAAVLDFTGAIASFSTGADRTPASFTAYSSWRGALQQLGYPNKATQQFCSAAEKQTAPAEALYELGAYYQDVWEIDKALTCFERADARNLKTAYALHSQVYVLGLQGRYAMAREKALSGEARRYYLQAERLLKNKLDAGNNMDLAELYLTFGEYKKTANCVEQWQKNNEAWASVTADGARAYDLLAAAYIGLERYSSAVKQLEKALEIQRGQLDYLNRLAFCLVKLDELSRAEQIYKDILKTAFYHVDALVGMGDLYKKMGENASTGGDSGVEEEHYNAAVEYYQHALNCMAEEKNRNRSSRILNPVEISALRYALGYVHVKLAETGGAVKDRSKGLKTAKENFARVAAGTPNYYKAQGALRRIAASQKGAGDRVTQFGGLTVTLIAGLVFIAAQLLFFWGKPIYQANAWKINSSAITELIQQKHYQLDADTLARLERQHFLSSDFFERELRHTLPALGSGDIDTKQLLLPVDGTHFVGGQQIGETTYGLFTFGALIFIVAGLSLQQLSKLKFGGIELEKASGPAVTTQIPLNISK